MKVFGFSGHGNYSEVFGWDNGLNSLLGKEITFEEAQEQNQSAVEYSQTFNSYVLPSEPQEGVYNYFNNTYGGSRTVRGFVIALTSASAKCLLEEFDATFVVVEYE